MKKFLKTFQNLDEALNFAEKKSESDNTVLYVIKSLNEKNERVFYVDTNGFVRSWEIMISTYENGKKI